MPAKKAAQPPVPPPAEILSREAADLALGELAKMAAQEAAAKVVCDTATAAAISEFNTSCKVDVNGEQVNIADRRLQLEQGLEAFARGNRKELFKEAKTLTLNYGEIGFREGNKSIAPIDEEEKSVKDRLIEKIIKGVTRAVKKLACGGCNVLSVSFSINKTGLLDAFRKGAFKAYQLKRFGLKIAVAERFFCEPKEQEVTSQPAGES